MVDVEAKENVMKTMENEMRLAYIEWAHIKILPSLILWEYRKHECMENIECNISYTF